MIACTDIILLATAIIIAIVCSSLFFMYKKSFSSYNVSVFLAAWLGVGILLHTIYLKSKVEMNIKNRGETIKNIITIFPKTADQIQKDAGLYTKQAQNIIEQIIAIKAEDRTFENTVRPLDYLTLSNIALLCNALECLELLSPDATLRETAHKTSLEIKQFFVEQVSNNTALYDAFMQYISSSFQKENLTEAERYFTTETQKDFERMGLNLPNEQREKVAQLKKELTIITSEFDKNIAEDKSCIYVEYAALTGVDNDFIQSLEKNDAGLYKVGVDYPTYTRVLEQCAVENTRKNLYEAFINRAYPANDLLLRSIIQKRDELAHLLGFSSYAHLELSNQMVKTPEKSADFLADLYKRAGLKEEKERALLTAQLPNSVTLTADGKLKPWDIAYLKSEYKKKMFSLDEQAIADYFPMEKTIEALFDIYQKFFSLRFESVPVKGLWHDEVKGLHVYKKEGNQLLGTLLLDLYPRPNKFSHAAHCTVIPSVANVEGKDIPDVSVVIANFPRETISKPSLLKRTDVQTFFHEFGHALHAILGKTALAAMSGTQVKTDFVEMPSQMLEEWLGDKDILRNISSHYQTGEPLSDDLLDAIIALKQFDSGMFVRTQARYATLALAYFDNGADKDPYTILADLFTLMAPEYFFDSQNHFYASFGHLTGYGAKYYSYLWSKVFALDLFTEIKKDGLLNPVTGSRYADIILARGGTKDPHLLLVEFLGREPRVDAFMMSLGL